MQKIFKFLYSKIYILCLAFLLLVGSSALLFVSANNTKTILENGQVQTLEKTYILGEEFALSENTWISYNGQEYEATGIIRRPNGNGLQEKTIRFDESGVWSVEYRANVDGKYLQATQKIVCYEQLYTVNGGKSFASYVQNNGIGRDGISVTLANGDTFHYNQIIDVSSLTKYDRLFSFYVTPATLYNYDAGQINFTLTDPMDESNTLTIEAKRNALGAVASEVSHFTYVTANATNQPRIGLEPNDNGDLLFNGQKYIVHSNNYYGRAVRHSMYGGYSGSDDQARYYGKEMHLSFDAEEKAVYAWGIDSSAPVLVADMDALEIFSFAWDGFSNGQALLSVSMSDYRASAASIVITGIHDHDLTKELAQDIYAPQLHIDLNGYDANALPKARVNTKYKIFNGYAEDNFDGRVPCFVSVWKNYSSIKTRERVSVENGYFTPTSNATYTIVYSAGDTMGNLTEKILEVEAENVESLTLGYLDDGSNVCRIGEKVAVKTPDLQGGSGEKTIKIYATLASNTSIVYDVEKDVAGKYTFVPLYQGEYTVTYEYSDYLENKTSSYAFVAEKATSAYIPNEAILPNYFINKAMYTLPNLTGYNFVGGVKESLCDIYVDQGTGFTKLSNNTLAVDTSATSVSVMYKLEKTDGISAQKTYVVSVVQNTGLETVGTLNLGKFFVNSNHFPVENQKRVNFEFAFDDDTTTAKLEAIAKNTDQTQLAYAEFDFINKILADTLSLSFSITSVDFSAVSIFITDSENSEEQVKLTYWNKGNWKIGFKINDGASFDTTYEAAKAISLNFDSATNTFYTNNNLVKAKCTENINGTPFVGFESGCVYVTFRVEGIAKATDEDSLATLKILTVNNQPISAVKRDTIKPEISEYVVTGDNYIGTLTKIPVFYACDVLDPLVTLSVKVYKPEKGETKEFAVSKDGVTLDGTQDLSRAYDLMLEEYGVYVIEIEVLASVTSRDLFISYNINVLDMEPPTVTFHNPITQASIGDTVAFAKFSLSDDSCAVKDITYETYLKTPSGQILKANGYDSFVASEKGKYLYIVYARDTGNSYGGDIVKNTVFAYYSILVK